MDELDVLRKALEAAQTSSTTQQLTEKNCLEIIFKLTSLQKVVLYNTTNGSEFVTPHRLESEILDALHAAENRINIVDLSHLLGVTADQAESKVNELVQRNRKRLFYIQGDLIRTPYIDFVCEEVNQLLQERGQLFLSEVSERYDLPTEFLRDEIINRLNISVHGTLHQQGLTSKTFEQKVLACLRGTLVAACAPVSLAYIATTYRFDLESVKKAVHQLQKDSVACGVLQNGIFYPQFYLDAQLQRVESFIQCNRFIAYETVKENGIVNVKEYLLKSFPNGCFLKNTFLTKETVDLLLTHIEDALKGNSWFDISSSVPAVLDEPELEELADILSRQKKGWSDGSMYVLLSKSIIVSNRFLEDIVERINPALQTKAKEAACNKVQARKEPKQLVGASKVESDVDSQKKSLTKKSKGGRKGKRKEDFEDEGESTVLERDAGLKLDDVFGSEEVGSILDEFLVEFPEKGAFDLSEAIKKKSLKVYEAALMDAKQAANSQRKLDVAQLSDLIGSTFDNLQLAIQLLDSWGLPRAVKPSSHPLGAYILATALLELVDPIIKILYHDKYDVEVSITQQNRNEMVDRCAAKDVPVFGVKLVLERLASSSYENLVEELIKAFDDANVWVHPLNKKREKLLAMQQKKLWRDRLERVTTEDPLQLFWTLLYNYIAQERGCFPIFPCKLKHITALWDTIKSKDNFYKSNLSKLSNFWEKLMELEKLKNDKTKGEDGAMLEKDRDKAVGIKAFLESEGSRLLEELLATVH